MCNCKIKNMFIVNIFNFLNNKNKSHVVKVYSLLTYLIKGNDSVIIVVYIIYKLNIYIIKYIL